jgi:hypothetical protein
MTPAEKPVEMERKRWLVCLAMKAMTLPMPVAIPAKSVSPKAIQKEPSSIPGHITLKGRGIASWGLADPAFVGEGHRE